MAYLCTDVHSPQLLGLLSPDQPQIDGQTLGSCGVLLFPESLGWKTLNVYCGGKSQSNNLNTSVPLVKSQMQSNLLLQKRGVARDPK